jgi:hypothetical protein
VLAIEEFETTNQRGRDDQRRIGKVERIADHKSGFVLQGDGMKSRLVRSRAACEEPPAYTDV